MNSPWLPAEPLDDGQFAALRQRAMFDYCKWDLQVVDTCVLARSPLVITAPAWAEVVRLAEALAGETLAAERELAQRHDLHRRLGMPRPVRHALRRVNASGTPAEAARLIRFDFHFTTDGWRISEANSDVPGGLNEASGLPQALADRFPWAHPVGDPAAAYADAVAAQAGDRRNVALVHATAYCDDHQMMRFVARRLESAGVTAHLASPSHLRWRDGRATLTANWRTGPLDAIVRFFPAEWLTALPVETDWPLWFAGARTPLGNPATAILTQSKRFPLVWDALKTPLPTWRALLPETRDPRDAGWRRSDEWIVKPTLGRVGEDVCMHGVTSAADVRRVHRLVRWFPSQWVVQRRFVTVPLETGTGSRFPCLGVYTLGTKVIGAYGRLARTPLVDERAADAAVLAA